MSDKRVEMTDGPTVERWWRDAVVYQIYPRSFSDSSGNGVGDLRGIIDRLDHLVDLGIDAIWLSPIFRSPMRDFGYDVADYCSVDPIFGTDDDLDALITALHERGMRLLLDWVPNHTSDLHPWFIESRSSRSNPRRDWYLWRDGGDDGSLPNNWNAAFGGRPAWSWDETTGQYYLHLFLPEQPDLNWANPEVQAAMHDTLRHWLDRGVDGFRSDVIHLIGKGTDLPDFPDDPPNFPVIMVDEPFTHELLRGIRGVLDEYEHQPMMIGEVYLLEPGATVAYLGDDDELHLTFDFRAIHAPWSARTIRRVISTVQEEFAPPLWPTWVLSNHDRPRQATRCGGAAQARAAAVVSLTMRGTPFLYAGEELGLEDAEIPPDRVVDPGGRDGCRAPIPWERSAPHGWGRETWLPFPPDPAGKSAEAQDSDAASTLHLYRRLLALRRANPALRSGSFELLDPHGDDHPDVIVYTRSDTSATFTTIVNMSDEHVDLTTSAPGRTSDALAGTVLLSSRPDGTEGDTFSGRLAPHEAVVVRRDR